MWKTLGLINTVAGVEVWNLDRLERKRELLAPGQSTVAMALPPGGGKAMTATDDGTVATWDIETGAQLGPRMTCRDKSPSSGPRRSGATTYLSPDGKLAALVIDREAVRLWNTTTGAPIGEPIRLGSRLYCAAFRPDGGAFATVGTSLELWDTASGRRIASSSLPPEAAVPTELAYRHDGKVLAMGFRNNNRGRNPSVLLWDPAAGMPVGELAIYSRHMESICFSPDGRLFATLDQEGTNRWWNATNFAPAGEPFWQYSSSQHLSWFNTACFRDDGKYCFTIEQAHDEPFILSKWLVPRELAGEPESGLELRAPLLTVQTLDGRMTVAGSNDGTIVVRDTASQLARGLEMRHRDAVLAIAINADGRTLATGSADATAQLWDLPAGLPLGPSLAHGAPVRTVAFRSDGKVLATGSNDGMARLWDAVTGTAIGPSLPHSGPVDVVAFDKDGTLLTRAADRIVRRWQIPRAAEDSVDRVLLWVEALTGAELAPEGVIRRIPSMQRWSAILSARERGVPEAP
jgi:WD40 repeat protein